MSISGQFFNHFAGEAVVHTIPVDGSPVTSGWTGATFKLFDQLTHTLQLTKALALDTPSVGSMQASLVYADTAALTPGTYDWEVWRPTTTIEAMVCNGTCLIAARRS